MATQLISHIDTPLLTLFAVCIAVLGAAALPWSDTELRRTTSAVRLGGAMLWRMVRPPQPTLLRGSLPTGRAVRFARSL